MQNQSDHPIPSDPRDISLPDPLDLLASYVELVREDLEKGDIERVLNYLRTICLIGAQVEQQLRLGIGIGPTELGRRGPDRARPSSSSLGRPRSKESALLSEAIVEILEERETPVALRELMDELTQRDVQLPGQGKAANLIAHMNRMPQVQRVKRGLYTLSRSRVS